LLAIALFIGAGLRYLQAAGFHLAWMFATGALFYVLRDRVRLDARVSLAALLVLLLASSARTTFTIALMLLGPYVVLCAAYLPRGRIRAINKLGDYSYGVYIYGAPVQISFFMAFPNITVWQLTAVATPVVLVLAAFSWHFVEKPSLKALPACVNALRRLICPPASTTKLK
jgi:peptidoglycan/LPS O-acetylase OafA/YrhL